MSESPGDLIANALRWLDENSDAPLMDRAAMALVVEAGGDVNRPVTFGAVAERLGIDANEAATALYALMESGQA